MLCKLVSGRVLMHIPSNLTLSNFRQRLFQWYVCCPLWASQLWSSNQPWLADRLTNFPCCAVFLRLVSQGRTDSHVAPAQRLSMIPYGRMHSHPPARTAVTIMYSSTLIHQFRGQCNCLKCQMWYRSSGNKWPLARTPEHQVRWFTLSEFRPQAELPKYLGIRRNLHRGSLSLSLLTLTARRINLIQSTHFRLKCCVSLKSIPYIYLVTFGKVSFHDLIKGDKSRQKDGDGGEDRCLWQSQAWILHLRCCIEGNIDGNSSACWPTLCEEGWWKKTWSLQCNPIQLGNIQAIVEVQPVTWSGNKANIVICNSSDFSSHNPFPPIREQSDYFALGFTSYL